MKDYRDQESSFFNPSTDTGMDFKELVKQGQEIIQKLSGESGAWTNYNTPDPGITILEHLSYAITDLSYRLSFPVRDLLEEKPDKKAVHNKKRILFSAKEILTVNPLTINDYRKLLIDIPEVKNAWIRVAKPQVKGLYQVFVEVRKYGKKEEDEVIEKVKQKLHQYRNLCEDFDKVRVLKPRSITIDADVEIQDNINITSLKEDFYKAIEQLISPEIPFYSVEELKARGKTVDEIFDGPVLEHGFIDDRDLERFDDELYVADIIEAIYQIKKVKIIRKFEIRVDGEKVKSVNRKEEALSIASLKINFYKDGYFIQGGLIKAPDYIQPQKKNTDLPLPSGRYRDLVGYNSVQEDFAHNYLLGQNSVSDTSVSRERKISSKQLKAYLLIFDQILANYFAQANSIKVLFNYIDDLEEKSNRTILSTYFSQPVKSPGIEQLVNKEEYKEELKKISEEPLVDARSIRKNRLLDYLLAIFGETFKDYSISSNQPDNAELLPEQKLINKKITYLTNYPKLSGMRGKAINYTLIKDSQTKHHDLYPLEESISNILGLTRDEFYLIEHILLRPFKKEEASSPFFMDSDSIYSYQISIIFPKEKEQDKDKKNLSGTLLEKINEVLRNEAPAHLIIHCHSWDGEQIGAFKKLYGPWMTEFGKDRTSNATLINSRIITKILCGIKGIGSMVIGDENADSKNYYHFTVYNDNKPPLTSDVDIREPNKKPLEVARG